MRFSSKTRQMGIPFPTGTTMAIKRKRLSFVVPVLSISDTAFLFDKTLDTLRQFLNDRYDLPKRDKIDIPFEFVE